MSNPTTSVTAKAPAPLDMAKSFLNNPDLQAQLKVASNKFMTPERITRIALTAVLQSPKLGECFTTTIGKASIAKALLTATQRGLEVDGRQGHLVPFESKIPGTSQRAMQAQFIAGYQGLQDLAFNHPLVGGLWSEEVYERDEFIYEKGLNRRLEHRPYEGDEDPGPLKAAYAVAELRSGVKVFVVLTRRDIKRIRAYSRSANSPDSIWNKHEAAMWKKSAVRALCKIIPQSNELRDTLQDEDDFESLKEEVKIKRANVTSPVTDPLFIDSGAGMVPLPGRPVVQVPTQGPEGTEQEALAQFVINECSNNFDGFFRFAVDQGLLSDASEVQGFADLEAALCVTILRQKDTYRPLLEKVPMT